MRATGTVVLLLSVALGVFAILAIRDAETMAESLPEISAAFGEHLDGANWKAHWLFTSLFYAAASVVGVAAGAAMLARRRWGLLLLCLVLSAALVCDVATWLSGLQRYAFEASEPVELAVLTVLTILSWSAYARSRYQQVRRAV